MLVMKISGGSEWIWIRFASHHGESLWEVQGEWVYCGQIFMLLWISWGMQISFFACLLLSFIPLCISPTFINAKKETRKYHICCFLLRRIFFPFFLFRCAFLPILIFGNRQRGWLQVLQKVPNPSLVLLVRYCAIGKEDIRLYDK